MSVIAGYPASHATPDTSEWVEGIGGNFPIHKAVAQGELAPLDSA